MSDLDWQQPDDLPPRRVFLASMAAVVTPPSLAAVYVSSNSDRGAALAIGIILLGSLIAFFHLPLALPAVFVLGRRWPLTWWRAALGGFVVGASPSALLAVLTSTAAVIEVGIAGLLGSVGGMAFWAALPRRSG